MTERIDRKGWSHCKGVEYSKNSTFEEYGKVLEKFN